MSFPYPSAACHSYPPTNLEAMLGSGVFQMHIALLGGPRRWQLPDVWTAGFVCLDYAPQLMARLTLAGQAMGDLSGFHSAMFIFHWDFSFKADLHMTPGPVHLGWVVTCLPFFSYWGRGSQFCSWRGCFHGCPHFVRASCLPRFSHWKVVCSTGSGMCVCERFLKFWGFGGFFSFKINIEIYLNCFKGTRF